MHFISTTTSELAATKDSKDIVRLLLEAYLEQIQV